MTAPTYSAARNERREVRECACGFRRMVRVIDEVRICDDVVTKVGERFARNCQACELALRAVKHERAAAALRLRAATIRTRRAMRRRSASRSRG